MIWILGIIIVVALAVLMAINPGGMFDNDR